MLKSIATATAAALIAMYPTLPAQASEQGVVNLGIGVGLGVGLERTLLAQRTNCPYGTVPYRGQCWPVVQRPYITGQGNNGGYPYGVPPCGYSNPGYYGPQSGAEYGYGSTTMPAPAAAPSPTITYGPSGYHPGTKRFVRCKRKWDDGHVDYPEIPEDECH